MGRLPLVLVAFPRCRSSGRQFRWGHGIYYLSGGGRRLAAVVVAPLLLSLVVFLRLESGWDVWFDLTVD